MALALRNVGTSPGASSTSCVVTKPAGLAVGDLLIAHIAFRINSSISAPDGTWNLLNNTQGSTTRSQSIFWKLASSSDVAASNFSFTCASSAGNLGALLAFSSGFDSASPIDQISGKSNSSGTDTTNAITPTAAGTSILLFYMGQSDDYQPFTGWNIATSDPGNWQEGVDIDSVTASLSLGNAWSDPRPQASSTGAGSLTPNIARANIATILNIKPVQNPLTLNNYRFIDVGDGMSTSEKIK